MKSFVSIFLMICFVSISGFSQPVYWWELKQSGSSLGGPIDGFGDDVYYGSNSTIYKSTDRGETFSQTGTNIAGSSSVKSIILNENIPGTFLVAVESSPNDKIYKTTDDGLTWTVTLNEGQMSFFGIPMTQDPSHPDTIYTMTDINFKRSTDFGSTWTTIASNFGPFSAPCDIEVFPNTSIILIGDNGTGIFKSTDNGTTWAQKYFTSGEIPTISVDFTNPGVAWATKWSGGGGLLKSTDFGETWNPVSGFSGINMWGVHVQPTDGNIVEAGCYSCGNTWRSINGGSSWTQISAPSVNYQVFIVDSITQFAAQGSGLYKMGSDFFVPVELTSFTANVSENEIILNWTTATELNNNGFEIEKSTDNENFTKIGFVPGFGTTSDSHTYDFIISEFSSGIQYYRLKQIDFDGSYTYTNSVEVEGLTPDQFTLSQNYPNPFNPSTSINFSLQVESSVTLKLFNMLGEEIADLFRSELPAGFHKYDFNGSALSSGTYFYLLETSGKDGRNFRSVKKMILMK
jgi:photosystem II stability/assembly factor-like uncharacterized protein